MESKKENLKANLLQELFELSIEQLQKEDNKRKISTYIIEPSFTYIFDRLYPYIILTAIIFLLLLLLFVILIFLILKNQNQRILI